MNPLWRKRERERESKRDSDTERESEREQERERERIEMKENLNFPAGNLIISSQQNIIHATFISSKEVENYAFSSSEHRF